MKPAYKMVDEQTGRYLPFIYPEELPFWEAARRRELVLQRCSACGRAWYPIGPACPHCFSAKWAWSPMTGRGTLHNYVVYHKAWTPYFVGRVPYAVVQVEIEEGPRLTTNLLGCALADIRIGMSVEVDYEEIPGEITLVQFRPVREQA